MTQAAPVDVRVNPNDSAQRYILWGNGRIDALGGAIPITGQTTWYDWTEFPVVVALHITNWATGAGYMLDLYGKFHSLNGAPVLGTDGVVQGVPYTNPDRNYVDWSWNPDGSGQGYALSAYGSLHNFGGAPASPRGSDAKWSWPAARKFDMRWTPDKRSVMVDLYGGLHGDFATTSFGSNGNVWVGLDGARDVVVTEWTTPSGYKLDLYGGVHSFGTNPDTHGWPYLQGADVARTLSVLSSADPIRFWEVWSGGQEYEFVSSTPPTVVAGGSTPVSPAATVTGTTRPVLTWTYSDPQKDSQAAWELYVFTQDFVTAHTMTDPSVWAASAVVTQTGTIRTVRGIASPVDLGNGAYRMYVRAQDTAGQWSAWSNLGWTQNVPLPATPTGLTATPHATSSAITATEIVPVEDPDEFTVALSVTATVGGSANLIRFECSDDAGATWQPVRGAAALPLAATTTAVDRDIPLGTQRTYRAIAYATNPAVASTPSATASATIARRTYALTAVDNPALGGHVLVQEPVEWVRRSPAGVFQGLGADYATVVSDGSPKGLRTTLHVFTPNAAAWGQVEALLDSDSVLVYRDPFGNTRYCKVVGDSTQSLLKGAALTHMHSIDLPLVEVRPPHLAR